MLSFNEHLFIFSYIINKKLPMDTAPVLYLGVVTVSGPHITPIPVQEPSSLPTNYVVSDVDKSSLFSSPISYTVSVDSSGFITSIQSTSSGGINATYLGIKFQDAASYWKNSNSVYDTTYSFDGSSRSVKFNTATSVQLLGTKANLGDHPVLLATAAIRLFNPTSISSVFSNASALAESLNIAISDAIANYLETPACQDAILQTILKMNGPIINTQEGTSSLVISDTINDMVVGFTIQSLSFQVSINGANRNLVLYDVPLFLNLTNL